MTRPSIVSRVNGLRIELLPHQAGILHRFDTPENRLFISEIATDRPVPKDTEQMMTIASSEDPAAAPAAKTTKQKEAVL